MRLFVDNLTNVDFSYYCPRRGLVGETWLAHIELEGELDQQGMICDFGIVKKQIKQWLDTELDHRLLVPTQNTHVHVAREADHTTAKLTSEIGEFFCRAPHQAITLANVDAINTESIAQWSDRQLRNLFDPSVTTAQLRFTPEAIDGPYYHYSHGLKKHNGNCQRIAHGHRSKLMVWRNGNVSDADITAWAERWRDVYIATREDTQKIEDTCVHFAYSAPQGTFELRVPRAQVYWLDTDSTVEQIADHLAQWIAKEYPGEAITVKAFEGVGKGAIAEARHTPV